MKKTDRAISMAEFADQPDDDPFAKYLLSRLASQHAQKAMPSVAEQAAMLTERAAALFVAHDFRPGDLVRYKRGLDRSGSEIKVALFIRPRPTQAQPWPVEIGYINEDGDMMVAEEDRRRLEPYVAE